MDKRDYVKEVVKKGDTGSEKLRAATIETLNNSEHVEIVGRTPVVRVPEDHVVVVHSAIGNPDNVNPEEHTLSLIHKLDQQAKDANIKPVGFANIIDSIAGDWEGLLENMSTVLREQANARGWAVLNGENAILSEIVGEKARANICGAMISIASKDHPLIMQTAAAQDSTFEIGGVEYAFFDPETQAVFINADGTGTKPRFYQMRGNPEAAIDDLLAMTLDDGIKEGAIARVVAVMAEFSDSPQDEEMRKKLNARARELGFIPTYQSEDVGGRIVPYHVNARGYNLNAALVSTIDEDRLKNPLTPQAGDILIAIRGLPNPRANGISTKREAMDQLGEVMNQIAGDTKHYSETEQGKHFLDFLATPSTVLYGVFKNLIGEGVASCVYHMSGGAYDGKLARPMAQAGLLADINNLFPPDPREVTLMHMMGLIEEEAYAQWPMGNDGFATTKDPAKAIQIITAHGLEAQVAGKVISGARIRTPSGKTIHYEGN